MQVGNSVVPFRRQIPIVAQICRTVTPKQVNIKYVLLGIIELNMVYISFWSTALLNSVLNGIYLQHFYKLIKRSNLDLFHLADLLHIQTFTNILTNLKNCFTETYLNNIGDNPYTKVTGCLCVCTEGSR